MMVMYVKRSGGQSQFSVPAFRPGSRGDRIEVCAVWIGEHLDEDLSAEALAARLHLSCVTSPACSVGAPAALRRLCRDRPA